MSLLYCQIWTFDELVGRSGLARRTLIDLEHGPHRRQPLHLHTLAHTFDVSLEHLLGSLCNDHTPPGTQGS
ncbi:XRE family transcriptional regulator [Streptomyces sp. NPDC002920]